MQHIFISYSRKDINFARKLAEDLEKAGYDVWWDISDLRGGDDWVRLIPDAIEASGFFIVVLSPDLHRFRVGTEGIYPGTVPAQEDYPDHA